MAVLQQYYTSYVNPVTGTIGFQVKATSPGIIPAMETTIEKLIAYAIPPSLDVWAIETHPVALRYFYESPERSYLLCSQSCGPDNNGRPGNFFAHTLVLPPDMFTVIPPISFWQSPFWRREDTETRVDPASLPVLSSFDEEPSLDLEGVWDFLAREGRRELLYKLLCGVIYSKKTYRRVVILDTPEHIVWWIAAVSTLLPPDYRPLLTFATYHQDPKQGRYLITGTTEDSSFGANPMDLRSFFVLNARTGVTSDVDDSAYARLAAQAATPELYEKQLLPVLADYIHRFPSPTAIDEQLNLVALYADLHAPRTGASLDVGELEAIHKALTSFEQAEQCTAQDIMELEYLQQVLSQSPNAQSSSMIARERERIDGLLNKYRQQAARASDISVRSYREPERPANGPSNGEISRPTGLDEPWRQQAQAAQTLQASQATWMNEETQRLAETQRAAEEARRRAQEAEAQRLAEAQRQVEAQRLAEAQRQAEAQRAIEEARSRAQSLEQALRQFVENIIQHDGISMRGHFEQLQHNYPEEDLRNAINQPAYLQWLIEALKPASSWQLRHVWETTGTYIVPGKHSRNVLIFILQAVGQLWSQQRTTEGKELLQFIWQVMQGQETAWLQLAADSYNDLPQGIVELFYYSLVHDLDLEQRVPYRSILLPISRMLLAYEITSDISSMNAQQGLASVQGWINHARQQGYDTKPLIAQGLTQLQRSSAPDEWRKLAPDILKDALFSPLPAMLEEQLVELTFSSFSLSQFVLEDVPFYQRYRNHPALAPENSQIINDILALLQGQIDEERALRIKDEMESLSPEEYQRFLAWCMPHCFEHSISSEKHRSLITALFSWQGGRATCFWQVYWDTFKEMLVEPQQTQRFVDMLAFWFAATPASLAQHPYIVQDFFLWLPEELRKISEDRRFQSGIQAVNKLIEKKRWSSTLQGLLVEKKSLVTTVLTKGLSAISSVGASFWAGRRKNEERQPDEKEIAREERRQQQFAAKVEGLFTGKGRGYSKRLQGLYRESESEFWPYYWRQVQITLTTLNAEEALALFSYWFEDAFEKFEKLDDSDYLPQQFFMNLLAVLREIRLEGGRDFQETVRRIDERATRELEKYRWYLLIQDSLIERKA